MCMPNESLAESKDHRRRIALGSLCISIGLLFPQVFHPAAGPKLNAVHFFGGLFLGLSLAINLHAVWKRSRRRSE
jgi:hypothetical protein